MDPPFHGPRRQRAAGGETLQLLLLLFGQLDRGGAGHHYLSQARQRSAPFQGRVTYFQAEVQRNLCPATEATTSRPSKQSC